MTQRFQPQERDSPLVAHPHRYIVRGEPTSLTFPPLCPCCGAPASTSLDCTKVFRRAHSDGPATFITTTVFVPFCAACARRHAEVSSPRDWWSDLCARMLTDEMAGVGVLALAVACFVYLAGKELLQGDVVSGALLLVVFGVPFAAFARWQWGAAQQASVHRLVLPQSDVTSAFDFSDDVAGILEPPRFVCAIRNARFAEAFARTNADRLWVESSPQGRAERRRAQLKLRIVGAVVLLVVVVSELVDWLR